MKQRDIPCLLMRGGTSRGPYFKREDLPTDQDELSNVLLAAMGTGSALQLDGIGGGQPTLSKVAMLSRSDDDWADIDFFFAQVHTEKHEIDITPSCGNILTGVGPAALEMGLLEPTGEETIVRIRNTNTGALTEAIIQTHGGLVSYDGDARIDGVPGTASPILLKFMNVTGCKTGSLFPTGNATDEIDGISLTCIDVAMPMVIGHAVDFGISGYESHEELDDNKTLFEKIEPLRIKAGELMGFENVARSVIPKFALLAAPKNGGTISARYFMPWRCHPNYAVTGSICTGSCLIAPGTIAQGRYQMPEQIPFPLKIEHPSGIMDVIFDYKIDANEFTLISAGLISTARKLFSGTVSIPGSAWPRK